MNEFTVGVVSGLVTTLIVFVVQVGHIKILRPWLEELLYRDLKIEGRWLVEYPQAPGFTEAVELRRHGHRVTGSVTVTDGPDKGRLYVVDGTFKNLILTLSFSGHDETRLDRGTYTLQTQNNGQHFLGYSAYYQDDKNAITALQCKWHRG